MRSLSAKVGVCSCPKLIQSDRSLCTHLSSVPWLRTLSLPGVCSLNFFSFEFIEKEKRLWRNRFWESEKSEWEKRMFADCFLFSFFRKYHDRLRGIPERPDQRDSMLSTPLDQYDIKEDIMTVCFSYLFFFFSYLLVLLSLFRLLFARYHFYFHSSKFGWIVMVPP